MEQVTNTTCAPAEVLNKAFGAFCEDLSGMFEVIANVTPLCSGNSRIAALQEYFPTLSSVNQMQSRGTAPMRLDVVFDQTGTLVIGGIFVMLPEKRIADYLRTGLTRESYFIKDAAKEAGSLLAGSWNRVFRDSPLQFELRGHSAGNAFSSPRDHLSVGPDEECFYHICRIKIEPYPEFNCGVLMSPAAAAGLTAVETNIREDVSGNVLFAGTGAVSIQETAADIAGDFVRPSEIEGNAANMGDTQYGPIRDTIDSLIRSHADGPLGLMTAEQVMKTGVAWVDAEATVEEAMKRMQQSKCSYLLVGKEERIEGIISRSDLSAAVSPYLQQPFAHLRRPLDDASMKIRVKWFMSRPVQSVEPGARLSEVMTRMLTYGVRGLPVITAEAKAVGFISVFDLLEALASMQ